MKLAIVGSRSLEVSERTLDRLMPEGVSEIVSGGACGIDRCAADYARAHGIPLREFLPDYDTHGRPAPILRNIEIVDYCDRVMVFWDGRSKGCEFVIRYARRKGRPYCVFTSSKHTNTD